MIIHENELQVEDFCALQDAVGFGRPDEKQVEIALSNSLYTLAVEVDGRIVGMGRLVGDGVRNIYIQDVFISPQYQRQGVGTEIVNKLLEHIKSRKLDNSGIMVGLMAAKGKEEFYKRLGFAARPNEFQGSGMMMTIK